MRRPSLCIVLLMLTPLLFLACPTRVHIPEDASISELFQMAQDLVDSRNNRFGAIEIYEAVIERFPENLPRIAEAKYEISLQHYRLGNLDKAKQGFESVLDLYEDNPSVDFAAWPKTLSLRLLDEIESSQ